MKHRTKEARHVEYEKDKDRIKARATKWNKTNWDRRKNILLKHNYGITLDDYRQIEAAQGGICAICSIPGKKLVVDHNHNTGQVRGLLCGDCNRALGIFKESRRILSKAIVYLLEHNGGNEEDFW